MNFDKINTMKLKYKKYIKEHIVNVQLIWEQVQKYLTNDILKDDCTIVNNLIEHHDESKYGIEEFYGYRQWFYPIEGEKNKTLFDIAWNHHMKTNPHHWEYWVMWGINQSVALPIPFPYIIEMLCDWSAMFLKFGDIPSKFYCKNKNKMFIESESSEIIEKLLPIFDDLLQDIRNTIK
jgi:hypothetical protein